MENIILVVHIIAAASVIGLVLIQHGKGADMGAAFGSGASGSLFGVSGSTNLLSRLTALAVVVFFSTSLTLAYLASHTGGGSVVESAVPTNVAPKKVDISDVSVPDVEAAPEAAVVPEAKDIPN